MTKAKVSQPMTLRPSSGTARPAEQGYRDAQYNLALMYDNGEGVTQDKAQAFLWYSKAAKQGDADAQFNVGVVYDNGDGVTRQERSRRLVSQIRRPGQCRRAIQSAIMYDEGDGVPRDNAEL